MLQRFCRHYRLPLPKRYKRQARKAYLAFVKSKKHTAGKVRAAIRKQLSYVRRDLGYLEQFMSEGYAPDEKEIPKYLTILKLYEQQKYMYDHKVHSVPDRIVSISQPWVRPIVKGKVTAPVEFSAKFDLSLDAEGYGRIEKYPLIRITKVQACRRLQSGTGNVQGITQKDPCRSDIPDVGEPEILQRTRDPVIGSKTWKTKCGNITNR